MKYSLVYVQNNFIYYVSKMKIYRVKEKLSFFFFHPYRTRIVENFYTQKKKKFVLFVINSLRFFFHRVSCEREKKK